MTELLSVGTAAESSADFDVAAGDKLALILKNATGTGIGCNALVYIEVKIGILYFTVGHMDGANPAKFVEGGGDALITYRVRRRADSDPCGVDGF